MRVVANLSIMFKSVPLVERYALAKNFGFRLVEVCLFASAFNGSNAQRKRSNTFQGADSIRSVC